MIRVWYYAAPTVAVVLAGSLGLSVVWRVWLQPRAGGGSKGKLPPWPASPEDEAPSLVVGELHHPTIPSESERPSWLLVPETGLYTRKGVAEAGKLAAEQGMDPGQEIRFARTRPAEAAHDTAIYRACRQEHQRLIEQGAATRRVRLDTELKSTIARRSESARVRGGRRADDAERHRAARELGLPVGARGRVLYPDAQIEYTDADGRTGRINIEVASSNYRAPSIRAKAAAGFVLHAHGPAAARLLRSLGVGDGNDRSSLRGPTDRDPAAIEL